MEFEDVLALITLTEEGSVLRTARKLVTSRGTVRRRLERIEATVGVPLVSYEGGQARLTSAGERVVKRGRSLLTDAMNIVTEARAAATETEGLLRMVVHTGLPNVFRAHALMALRRSFPGLRLSVREVDDPLGLLGEAFELMIHYGPPPHRGHWYSRAIRRVPLGLVASPAYLASHGTPANLADLSSHQVLMWSLPGQADNALPRPDGRAHPVVPLVTSSSLQLIRTLASVGAGIAFCGCDALPPDDPHVGPLVRVLEGEIAGETTARALSPVPTRADPRARALLENLQQMIDSLLAA